MQFKNLLKGLVIAVPAVTLMACQSGPSEAELEAERNRVAQQQADAERLATEAQQAEEAKVKAAAAARLRAAEDEKMREMKALQGQQTIYFDFDRSSIKSDFYAVLDMHASYLVKHSSQSIVIEGHTDNRGTPEYNIALGERRAKSVETYLQNAGVSGSQISVVSYGEEKPANFGTSEASFEQNRRAVIVYQ